VKPRFQADNDLRNSIRLGVLRREPSIESVSAREAQLDHVSDPDVLLLCGQRNRLLVSHDENSMPSHFQAFIAAGHHSPGVLIVPQHVPTGEAIESLLLLWLASEAAEWAERIAWLPL
jgi:hypothetical protein